MRSRRRLLQEGAGVTGAGVIATLAGCSGTDTDASAGESGNNQSDERRENGADEDTTNDVSEKLDYTEWAYDQAILNEYRTGFIERDVEGILSTEYIPSDTKADLQQLIDWSETIVVDDVSSHLQFLTGKILTGSFDRSALLNDPEITHETNYRGFDIYTHTEDPEDAAVAGQTSSIRFHRARNTPPEHSSNC